MTGLPKQSQVLWFMCPIPVLGVSCDYVCQAMSGVLAVCLLLLSNIKSLFKYLQTNWEGHCSMFFTTLVGCSQRSVCDINLIVLKYTPSMCLTCCETAVSRMGVCYVLGVKNGKIALECSTIHVTKPRCLLFSVSACMYVYTYMCVLKVVDFELVSFT